MRNNDWLAEGLFTVHGKDVEELLRQAVAAALWRHKQLGQSVAVLRDGEVVIVPPEEITIDEDAASRPMPHGSA